VHPEVVLKPGELGHHQPALDVRRGFRQQVEGLAVAAEPQQRVGGGLHAGAEPRLQLQRPAGAGQRVVQAVGEFVGAGPLDARPRAVRGDRLGPVQPPLGPVEVAQPGGDEPLQRQPVGVQLGRGIGPVGVGPHEPPRRERAEPLEPVAGVVVDRLGVGRGGAEGEQVEAAAEVRGAELDGEPAADQPGRGAGPGADRAEPGREVVRLAVPPLGVQLADAGQIGGSRFHSVFRRGVSRDPPRTPGGG
jgi:hypothetical protein